MLLSLLVEEVRLSGGMKKRSGSANNRATNSAGWNRGKFQEKVMFELASRDEYDFNR